jgi:hypothetical protein
VPAVEVNKADATLLSQTVAGPALILPAGRGFTLTVFTADTGDIQPFTVLVTVKLPAALTVIDCVFAPLLHALPAVELAVRITLEPWQIAGDTLVVIVGVAGITFGAAVPLPAGLEQPNAVCVTVYIPAVGTVIDVVVAPVLHDNVPITLPAVNTDVPQLLTTDTVGADTNVEFGAAVALRTALVQPLIVCVKVYVPAADTVIALVVAPVLHNNEPVKLPAVNTERPH